MTKKMKQVPQMLEGVVDMTQGGGAYVVVEGGGRDVFVRPSNMNGALEGDRVKVVAKPTRKGGKPEGTITEILQRSTRAYAGIIDLSPDGHYGFVSPDSRKIPYDIFVHLGENNTVRDGAKVLVRIKEWDSGRKSPNGELIDVLGMPGDNDTEMHSILAEFDLPYKFEKEVLDDAERIPGEITKKDLSERRDMREVTEFF